MATACVTHGESFKDNYDRRQAALSDRCLASGGTIVEGSLSAECSKRFADAGSTCTSLDDCEGHCFIDNNSAETTPPIGFCQGQSYFRGCRDILLKNGETGQHCID